MNSLASAKLCLLAGMMNSNQETLPIQQIDSDQRLTKEMVAIKPLLQFLHHIWWRIHIEGLECLPAHGPVFVVANTNSSIPWPALMFIYALMMKGSRRHVNVFADMDAIVDERIISWLHSISFTPWSYDSAKNLLRQGEMLLVFPEQIAKGEPHMSNRLKRFDWTQFLPAIEANVPIYPLATLGMDDLQSAWLPKLIPFPAPCKMRLMDAVFYNQVQDREVVQDEAKRTALFAEGEIQAEINRQLRIKNRK